MWAKRDWPLAVLTCSPATYGNFAMGKMMDKETIGVGENHQISHIHHGLMGNFLFETLYD